MLVQLPRSALDAECDVTVLSKSRMDGLQKEEANVSTQPHYARTVPFDQLLAELEGARDQRLVYARANGSLQLWCYTSKAVYDKSWTPAVLAARGLVLDLNRRKVVATAFPKFFNVSELQTALPNEPFEVFEKVDGSLIVIFHDGSRWCTATKGAFDSPQALWSAKQIEAAELWVLEPGTTYLAEAVYPENRIVVRYSEAELVLLAAYDVSGVELSTSEVLAVAGSLGWRFARRELCQDMGELKERTLGLSADEEGYVIRYESGLRVKLKGTEYARIHALISRVTPLGLWDGLAAGDDLDEMRRLIPEEFWWDFDQIRRLLEEMLARRLESIRSLAAEVAHLSDKELGLKQRELPSEIGRYLFSYRRNPDLSQDTKASSRLLRDIRPNANVLPGYAPSYAVQRVAADE